MESSLGFISSIYNLIKMRTGNPITIDRRHEWILHNEDVGTDNEYRLLKIISNQRKAS